MVAIKDTGRRKRGNNGGDGYTWDNYSGIGYGGLDEDGDGRYFGMIEREVVETHQRRRNTEKSGSEGRGLK